MDPIVAALVTHVVIPGAVALLGAVGAWLVTRLPGPLRAWLASGTHQRDMELLLGAMTRKAMERLTTGGVTVSALPALLAEDVVAYAKANLPGTIAKLAPDEAALRTMATAIVAEAAAKLAGKEPVLPAKGVL
ncbi:hypothetical protein [Roseomonas xinghualingensis]|uniref:hypothetical protein n=1 Tax=Roseomonas xinghualingensis TaxID=2986475 RepID=UPI0021F1F814|nr:hypothetical protein [Roseomonas sp. SXEYE001]MCV4209028.1 hypothetical protein [Roseomonas sp. SXEYE001]